MQRLSYSPLFADDGAGAGRKAAPAEEETSTPVQRLQRATLDGMDGAPDASGAAPRDGASASTLPYRQATSLLDCIRIMGADNADECRHEILGTPRQVPPLCVPATDPTWSDFTGAPPSRTNFAAETDFHFDTAATDWGFSIIRAFFDSTSWRKPDAPQRQQVVSACQAFFAGQSGSFSLTPPAHQTCNASISANTSLQATTGTECETVLGAEIDRVVALESTRLLTHEQYHFRLACAMASKGTDALRGGSSRDPAAILRIVQTKANTLTSQYDTQTNHGCNAAQQSAWQTRIDAGLPGTTVP